MEDIETLLEEAEVHLMAGGVYFAEVPGLFGIWGHGPTPDESLEDLRTNLATYLSTLRADASG